MKLFNEADILDIKVRKQIIDEIIKGKENIARREEALRRHEVYRDKNSKWVMKALENEGFRQTTIEQMRNRASNVSICRKIINKLAQTYTCGVDREAAIEKDQESIDALADQLDINAKLKKTDRFRQLHKNAMVMVVPVLDTSESIGEDKKYFLSIKVLSPWEYDVVEDPYDKECPKVVVLSDFLERDSVNTYFNNNNELAGSQGRRLPSSSVAMNDSRDEIIADDPADSGRGLDGTGKSRHFIFWSDNFHLTCFRDGSIVPGSGEPDNSNPIETLPFVNFAMDQDGAYWADGGEDVVDGSILINKELTDLNFIAFTQGFGQLVIDASNVPKKLNGGPDNAFIFERQPGEQPAAVFYATSNPPIKDWLDKIMSYVRVLLTTNNLSVNAISASADSVSNAQSGIAMIIDNSEIVTDLKDVQKLFQDREPELWEVIMKWHALYADKNSLCEDLQMIPKISDPNVKLKFHSVKPPVSEGDELKNMQLRQTLGIVTLKDLVKQDNPDLSDEDADKKVEELKAEKVNNNVAAVASDLGNSQATPGSAAGPNADGGRPGPGTQAPVEEPK